MLQHRLAALAGLLLFLDAELAAARFLNDPAEVAETAYDFIVVGVSPRLDLRRGASRVADLAHLSS